MLNWIRQKLRNWLKEEEPVSQKIEASIDGNLVFVFATGVIGLRLNCNIPAQHGSRVYLLSDHQVCNKEHFWNLWKHLGGKASWEDGEPFEP